MKCCNWWRSGRDVLISWRLPGALSHRICTLHLAPALLPPPTSSAFRRTPPSTSIGSVATFSCLNVYDVVCAQLRTPGSARVQAPPQVHIGLCPALPPHQCFRVSKYTLMEMSGTTHSIDPSPPIPLVSVSFHWKELRSYLLPPPPLGAD